jgi:hypothetical protein
MHGAAKKSEFRVCLARQHRAFNNSGEDPFCLQVDDSVSGGRVLELKFTPQQFADLLSTRPVECEGTARDTTHVGKRPPNEKTKTTK